MNVIDLAIIMTVLFGLWRGYQAGAIRTAMSLVAWLFGLVMASIMADDLAPLFSGIVDSVVLQITLAFILVVLATVICGYFITWMILKTLKSLHLTLFDKVAGGALGIIKGVLKVLIIMGVLSPLLMNMPSWQSSALAQSLLPFTPVARQIFTQVFAGVSTYVENPYADASQ